MSHAKILLLCIVLTMAITGNLVAQNKASSDGAQAGQKNPPIWNFHKLQKWYEDNGLTLRHDAAIVPPRTVSLTPLPPDQPDVQVFPSSNHETENSIAVSQANPMNLMVSVNELNSQPAWFSTDGGASWFGNESNPGGTANYGDPVALFDLSGAAYWVTLGDPGGIKVGRTTNFGGSWTITSADPSSSSGNDKEHAMTDLSGVYPNNVYAAWTDFNVTGYPVVLTRSTNSGATWGARTSFPLSGAAGQGTNIATGPNGEVYLTFSSLNGSSLPESGIAQAKSTDGGATWSAARILFPVYGIRVVNTGQARFNNTRAPSFPSTAVDRSTGPRRGWVYIAYSGDVSSAHTDADIYLHRSSDGGATWSSAIRVNTEAPGSQQWMPGLAVDQTSGRISLGYYSMDTTVQYLTARYVASSEDGGDTWQYTRVSDVRFTPSPLPPPYAGGYCGDYYETASYNGKAWACWSDNRVNNIFNAYVSKLLYAENFGWVKGTVTNTSGGAQLPGVAVDFTDPILQQGGTSNGVGFYVAGARVDTPGTTRNVTLRARKFGFRDTLISITLTRNDTLTANFAMTPVPNGTLVVRTVRKDSTNIRSGITVLFAGSPVASGNTDSLTGIYSTVLPLGSYDVLVDPPSPYGNRRFNGVTIATGSNPLYVVVRAVIENSPAAMRDTLAVGGLHTKVLQLANTTATDTVSYRLSDDNALARMRLSKPVVQPREVPVVLPERPKGAPDIEFGDSPTGGGGPDAFGYRWVDSDSIGGGVTYNWVEISSVGTPVTTWTGSTDDGSFSTTLPWSFPYYGNGYTSFFFTTNGWIGFNTPSTQYSNAAIPNAAEPNNAIYAWWDDLQAVGTSGNGTVYYYNDVANSQYIVQYNNVRHLSATTDTLKFQAILKPNGEILLQYNRMVGTTNLTSATIGIENADGSTGLQVVFNAAYIHDNLAIKFYLPDAAWISESPSFGRINPGATQNITVTFDAAGLLPGTTYNGKILLDVTHPDVTGTTLIPASLKVNPASGPVIILSKTSITFPPTEIGFSRQDSLVARNGGTAPLTLSSLTTTNTRFTVLPTSGNILPGDSLKIRVTYTSIAPARADTGRLIILNNDPFSPRRDVALNGTALGVAHFVVTPDTFAFTRNPAVDTTRATFRIRNTGTDTLRYQIGETNNSPFADAAAIQRSTTQQTSRDLPKGAVDPTPGETDSSGGPDAFGYRWIDSDSPGGPTFNWVDIKSVGTQITWSSQDDGTAAITLPFSFPFYGTTYTSMTACTNGFTQFSGTSTAYNNIAIPATALPNNAIYAWWDDTDFNELGGTAWQYFDAANQRFIVQFDSVGHHLPGTTPGRYTYQYILYPSGNILVLYRMMQGTLNSATIGIEDAVGTVGLQVVFNASYVHDNMALLFTKDIVPWMSTDRTSGTIAPGDSQAVQLRIHPFGTPVGTYYGVQRITGNTPDVGRVRVGLRVITGVGESQAALPMEFALSQNYPNPFNPTTTIKYDLPIDAGVSLKVFNIIGQEVVTLVNEEQKAGYRSVEWNASNVASGVYFYRLDAGSFTNVKKLLLLK
jgi:hypothetical protein